MRIIPITVVAMVALTGCDYPLELSPAELAEVRSTRAKLAPCKHDIVACDGLIIQYDDGLLERIVTHDPDVHDYYVIGRTSIQMRLESDRWLTGIREVYGPEHPGFMDAVARHACQSNVACAKVEVS